jgi:hypothetical protein
MIGKSKVQKDIRCLQYSKLQPLANFRMNRKPTRYHCAKAPPYWIDMNNLSFDNYILKI